MTDGHLTDEQLSSHLDEMAGSVAGPSALRPPAPDAEHLAGCSQCRARLAALEAVRDLIRTPVAPVAPDLRAASIATVLRAAEGQGAPAAARGAQDDGPVPLRSRRRPQVLVGAAAAVLVLATAVAVPLALSRTGTSNGTAASAPASPSSPTTTGLEHRLPASGTYGLSENATASVSDLGAIDSLDALRARVAALLPEAFAPSATGAASAAATPRTTGVTGTTGVPGTTGTTGTTATGSTKQATDNVTTTPGTTGIFEHCLASAVHAAGPGRDVELLATTKFKGTASLVYVFFPVSSGSPTGNAARPEAVVTGRAGCRVLATTSL